ncbi:unnamed protein product [Brassica oleracea var. botrytis]
MSCMNVACNWSTCYSLRFRVSIQSHHVGLVCLLFFLFWYISHFLFICKAYTCVCRVVETQNDYAIKALVNTVDHLGSVIYEVTEFVDEKVDQVAGTCYDVNSNKTLTVFFLI